MTSLSIDSLADSDIPAVVALWTACGLTRLWNDPQADIALARSTSSSDVLVMREAGSIIGAVMVGHDGHRGAVYYLAVSPDRQGEDFGRALMQGACDWLSARGVSKLNLMVRPDNERVAGFYDALGFAREERIVFSRRLDIQDDENLLHRRL